MDQTICREIAERLRGLRDSVGLEAEAMAEQVGVTADKVHLYESGTEDIPVSYLFSVAKAFGMDPTVLMSGDESHLHDYSLVKQGGGIGVEKRKDYDYKSLAYRFLGRKMEPFRVTVPPKAENELDFNEHPGQEFVYMLEGRLEVALGEKRVIVEPGDSLYFGSHIPHAMRGLDGKPAAFLDVII